MRLTQSALHISILILLTLTSFLGALLGLIEAEQTTTVTGLVSTIVFGILLAARWQKWLLAANGPITITLLSLIIILSYAYTGDFSVESLFLAMLFPPLIANIIARPIWVAGSGVSILLCILILIPINGDQINPFSILMYISIVGGMILSRLATDNIQRLEDANQRASQALAQAEQQVLANARQAQELTEQNEAQQRLLELVATLETPTVTMADGVLFAPIVGYVDSRRADRLITQLLDDANNQRARLVILDIAGVPTIDTATANTLLRATAALRLLGCQVALTGISPEIAVTLTHLDVDLSTITTVPTPQEAIQRYTEQLDESVQSHSPDQA